MANQNEFLAVDYGFTQPLNRVFPVPIVSKRAPTTADKAPIGQLWVEPSVNGLWILSSIVNNLATWTIIEAGGGAGVFASLVVNPGPTSLSTVGNGAVSIGNATNTGAVTITVGTGNFAIVGGGHSISIGADAAVANTIAIGGTGANVITIGDTQTAGSISLGAGMTTGTLNLGGTGANTGTITIAGGTGAQIVNIAAAGTGAKTINLGATGSADTISIGSTTAASTLALKTPTGIPVTSANGLTATVGNLTASNGNVVISTAATFLQLPGPVKFMSGAGVPGNGLAAEAGDMYINTTPTGATDRLFIATAASTWTNVTCAA